MQFKGTDYKFDIHILRFYIENLFVGKLVPNLKLHRIYLKISTQGIRWTQIWQRHGDLTVFYSKPKFGQIGAKSKISSDLLENLYTRQFEGIKCESNNNILILYT